MGSTIQPTLRSLLALALLAALALALMLPALLGAPLMHDSFWIDYVWTEQFTALLRAGVPYPRWLPLSHGGLGAPVFYFYAPLAFYWTGLFGLLGLGTYAALLAAAGAAWFASGAAMWWWLRGQAEDRFALLGAAAYMAMPYHAFDFYRRGAIAEFCAYAILPLLFVALRRAAMGRGHGALAVAYAALILTHLPTALLASVLLVAPWGAWRVRRDRASAMPLAFGVGLGIMLAALYLVPALTLQRFVLIDQLWSVPLFQASSWNLFAPSPLLDGALIRLFAAAVVLLAATAALFATRGDRWALWAIAACALIAGVVPALWAAPMMAKVQFPWRALLLVEFALATAIARSRLGGRVTVAAVAPLLIASLFVLRAPPPPSLWTPARLTAQHPEVREYLPAGAPAERETYSPWALALARHAPPGSRFAFPAWQVRCGGAPAAVSTDRRTRLLSFRGEGCAVSRTALPQEWIGGALSLAALLTILFPVMLGRSRRRRAGPSPSPRA